jgi:hypothetical protein
MSSTSTYTFHMQENMERIFGIEEDRNPILSDQELSEKPENWEPYVICESEKARLRQLTKEQFADPVMRKTHLDGCYAADAMHKNKKWMNKEGKNRRIKFKDVDKYLEMGYTMGRYIPKENAFWNYDKTGENNPFWNKKHTGDMSRFSRHNKG